MRVLRFHHAEHEMHRARNALVELGQRMRDDLAPGRIVPAVEPNLSAVCHIGMQSTDCEPLEPRWPFSMGQPMLECTRDERVAEQDARAGDGSARVIDLVSA